MKLPSAMRSSIVCETTLEPMMMYDDVKRVYSELVINGTFASADEISRYLGIACEYSHSAGDPVLNTAGQVVGKRRFSHWVIGSSGLTDSKNLDVHLRSLLQLLMPVSNEIQALSQRHDAFLRAVYESTRLDFGSGPILSAAVFNDIGALGLDLHFDIYCALEHDV